MTRARGADRRGFALVYVIMVAMVVSLVLSATLTRQDAQIRLVHRQVRDYQHRHDMLGARAAVELWLSRIQPAALATLAREPGPHYTFVVEGVIRLEVTARDGQGLPLGDATLAPQSMTSAYRTLLRRLPVDRAGLVRFGGSGRFSPATAPRAVLATLLEDPDAGERFADDVIALRERGPLDEQEFYRLLSTAPNGDSLVLQWRPVLTFEPSIWRLDLTVTDSRGESAVFGMIAEHGGPGGVQVLERLTEADLRQREALRERRDRERLDRPRTRDAEDAGSADSGGP